MAYRCHRLFFFFFSERSGQALCCHIFFNEKKKKKKKKKRKKKLSCPLGQFNVDYIMYRCYRPECLWGILFKMATTTIVKKTI